MRRGQHNSLEQDLVIGVLRKYDVNPRVATEVAPLDNPHFFCTVAYLYPTLQSYVAVDADWDKVLGESVWKSYCRKINEQSPPSVKTKFRRMLQDGEFKKVAGWYFNTGDFPSDLVFHNNSLPYSFPALNLAKSLRDIRAQGLILIKGRASYGEEIINLLEAVRKDLNFGIETYLADSSAPHEHVLEQVEGLSLREWNETMRKWLGPSRKSFFIALKNRGGEISPRDCLELAYRAWLEGYKFEVGLDAIRREDMMKSFKEFGEGYLLRSLEEFDIAEEKQHVRNILQRIS